MSDEQADLRLLYQVIAGHLSFSKNRQWTVAYYGILVLAGLVGAFKLFDQPDSAFLKVSIFVLAFVVTILVTFNIIITELEMCQGRKDYTEITRRLSSTFQELNYIPANYAVPTYDIFFWLPLVASLWLAFAVASFYVWRSIPLTVLATFTGFLLDAVLLRARHRGIPRSPYNRPISRSSERSDDTSLRSIIRRSLALARWITTGRRVPCTYSHLYTLLTSIFKGDDSTDA